MKFTVHYIPLSKIKQGSKVNITERIKRLQGIVWDCMYLIVVKENQKDGSYTLVSGLERYDYLKNFTKNVYAPCLVDQSTPTGWKGWFYRLRKKDQNGDYPLIPKSWSIVRTFLKQEPRFKDLSRFQQIRVLYLGARYKRTVILTMQKRVNQLMK
ncbi:hypothetical protein [Pseudalkalibacillus berkeleyi]|uniref:ParB/Sulfiredoxin domain-containing protein n=1 Tax=Pseudalkalibacillus berkeleyi TaxID=1069813 RepID=A0ABS9H5Q1_9BACL|nr:hypothetical protein [Pseudalkalibacillus berkeleyi]MCF6139203.1 hypothetical protein [Pseudalkalibacillus berkeleyi]